MRKRAWSILSNRLSGQSGQALILVLVFLLLGSLTIMPSLAYMTTALKTGTVYENNTREYYAADAGIEDGIWQIKYDRLRALSGDEYFAYDFSASCSYGIEAGVNGYSTNVTIDNFWIPTAGNPYTTPAGARSTLERDITDNTTNRLTVIGGAWNDVIFRIKLDFYPSIYTTQNMCVSSIGIWIPHGFAYNGNCVLDTFSRTHNKYVETITDSPGGQVVVWDFSANPLKFPDLPGAGGTVMVPTLIAQPAEITFNYTADEFGTRPSAVAWIVTSGPLHSDIPMAWDIATKYYKLTSIAGKTNIVAYVSRYDPRQGGAAFPGDYCAIGNTLMRDTNSDQIRDTLDATSTADTKNPDLSYRIPDDAVVMDSYLYWSGWFKCDASHPKATVFSDTCGALTNWSQNGSAWTLYPTMFPACFQGHYAGSNNTFRYLTLKNPVNLAGRTYGSVVIGWSQKDGVTGNNLEPLSDPVNGDALQFQFSKNNGASWGPLITAFEDDLDAATAYYYIVPESYLTSTFKVRFYLKGFTSADENCYIDDFHIGDVADRNISFSIGNPLAPAYSGTFTADEFKILGDFSVGEYSYSCKKNVSSLVNEYCLKGSGGNPTGNGQYTVGGADADTGTYWAYCGWSMIIVYSSPQTAGRQLFLFDRFAFGNVNQDVDFDFNDTPGGDISGFIIPEPITGEPEAAKLTCFVGDGDNAYHDDFIALNAPEMYRTMPGSIPNTYKLWDGITTSYNNQSAPNNVWNSKFKVGDTGSSSIDGIDIDTFHITWASGLLHANDTSAHIDIYSNYESYNLIYLILSVRSKVTIGGTTHYLITSG
jgi:hypothetical protein